EPFRHLAGDRRQGPLRVDPLAPHPLCDRGEKGLVGGDHAVRLEDRRELGAHVAERLLRLRQEVLRRGVGGALQPPLLGFHLVGRDSAAESGRAAEPHDNRAPDREARTDGNSLEHGRVAYSSSSKLRAIKSSTAAKAAASSSPLTERTISVPCEAASSRIPRMLLPSTSSPFLRILTADLKRLAVWTNFAAGRAWRPHRLGMSGALSIIGWSARLRRRPAAPPRSRADPRRRRSSADPGPERAARSLRRTCRSPGESRTSGPSEG